MTKTSMPLRAALVLLLVGASAAHAQQAPTARQRPRVPVTVVLLDRLPQPDAAFLIDRRPGSTPHDRILLPRDAGEETFSQAVHALLLARRAGGDTAAAPGVLRLRPRAAEAPSLPRLPWAGRVLADLRTAAPREVSGLGRVRAVEIWLPPQGRRAAAPAPGGG